MNKEQSLFEEDYPPTGGAAPDCEAAMIVKVERCTGVFRLTMPCGSREFISNPEGDLWCRKFAAEALDMLENLYDATRRNVRFEHLN